MSQPDHEMFHWGNLVRFPAEAISSFYSKVFQTVCGGHPKSFSRGEAENE
jgi:hypothetical protein